MKKPRPCCAEACARRPAIRRCTTPSACGWFGPGGRRGLVELRRAHELAPGEPRFALLYAISLESAGRVEEALAVLRAAQQRSPGARELLVPLVTINRDRGARREARLWARRLVLAAPDDPEARTLSAELQVADASADR